MHICKRFAHSRRQATSWFIISIARRQNWNYAHHFQVILYELLYSRTHFFCHSDYIQKKSSLNWRNIMITIPSKKSSFDLEKFHSYFSKFQLKIEFFLTTRIFFQWKKFFFLNPITNWFQLKNNFFLLIWKIHKIVHNSSILRDFQVIEKKHLVIKQKFLKS